jgi:CRP-like cAMP-binding protein
VSNTQPAEPIRPEEIAPYCAAAAFEPGQLLRARGQHYRDLYLIADGRAEVRLAGGKSRNGAIVLGPGSTIGEIGFLRGSPATAEVVALEAARALIIDDGTMQRIEAADPGLAIRLSRFLATTSAQRSEHNNAVLDASQGYGKDAKIEVLLCRNDAQLEEAQQLRYTVYCDELGRDSPNADHEQKTIKDGLDDFGHTFVAVADGEAVGTLRANLSREGDLGILETLYGMTASPQHPDQTCICTKFIIKRSHRGGAVTMALFEAVVDYLFRHRLQECYIDCIPALLPYYKAMGFTNAGATFLHPENGPSYPMKLRAEDARKLVTGWGPWRSLRIYLRAQVYRWLERGKRKEAAS